MGRLGATTRVAPTVRVVGLSAAPLLGSRVKHGKDGVFASRRSEMLRRRMVVEG